MKIAVNTRHLINQKLGGIGWFTYEILKRIVIDHPENEFFFIFDRPYHEKFIFSKNVIPIVIFPPARHPILWYWWFEHSLPKILEKIKPDIFLSMDGYLSLNTTVKQIAVIHDLSFEHYPLHFKWIERQYHLQYSRKFAIKADRIITVSEYSKLDIIKTYNINPNKIDIVYNASNSIYFPLTQDQKKLAKEKYAEGNDYFIYIGALLPRKNIARLLKAFEKFKDQNQNKVKLLIVGAKFFNTKDIALTYKKHSYKSDIIFTGHLPENEINMALGGSIALTYISYFEGFGIPIVEAFNAEVPVITSNISSMPEVAGDAALLADPFSIDSIANAMQLIYSDEKLRNELIEKGRIRKNVFSWNISADKVWHIIQNEVNKIN